MENEQQKSGSSPAESKRGLLRTVGLGLITGAADDDPSAIGTYASAGAKFGTSFLWVVPAIFPMTFTVVYLSSKLGQVSGRGLFDVIRAHYPKWVLYPSLIGVVIGNIIEAAADLGGMAAAINLIVPLPIEWIAVIVAIIILLLQIFGSYFLIRNIFLWLALVLVAYIISAIMAKPDILEALKGTFIPTVQFDQEFLSLIVAVIGTTLSAYVYTWQSNQEVEEEIAMGRTRLAERKGATHEELKHSRRDVVAGMAFSHIVMYFIILSTAATLFKSGHNDINTAADAAEALRPLAGDAAGMLFTVGIIGVGFLAVPVMTVGAAYDLCQAIGWKCTLHARPSEAKEFYVVIVVITAVAVAVNFIDLNPMKALVWAGIVQGFSIPPLLLLIMLMTNSQKVMGRHVNGVALNIFGWGTFAITCCATVGLVTTWLMPG